MFDLHVPLFLFPYLCFDRKLLVKNFSSPEVPLKGVVEPNTPLESPKVRRR